MFKIITTKRYRQMLADIESQQKEIDGLRGSLLNMQNLHKGHYNKYRHDCGNMYEEITKMEKTIGELESKLRKTEHQRNEALKKLRKYENESRGK